MGNETGTEALLCWWANVGFHLYDFGLRHLGTGFVLGIV
jgi:hypothetical protein